MGFGPMNTHRGYDLARVWSDKTAIPSGTPHLNFVYSSYGAP
jgi:hypothetical protein